MGMTTRTQSIHCMSTLPAPRCCVSKTRPAATGPADPHFAANNGGFKAGRVTFLGECFSGFGRRSSRLSFDQQQLRFRPAVLAGLVPVTDGLHVRFAHRRGLVAPLAADVGEHASDLLVS